MTVGVCAIGINDEKTSADDSMPSATSAYEFPMIPVVIFTKARIMLVATAIPAVCNPVILADVLGTSVHCTR
jgi:hypothetical protein